VVPVLAAIYTTLEVTQFNCGGNGCDPIIWMPKLRVLALGPILLGSLHKLPFWGYLWSRLAILVLALICHFHIIQTPFQNTDGESGQSDSADWVGLAVFLLLIVWEHEQTERKCFRLQQAESTAILGAVSHDLRTPIHVVRSIINHLQSPKFAERKMGDSETKAQLAQADHGCKRMEGLVEDLLLASTMYNTEDEGLVMRDEAVIIRKCMQEHVDLLRRNVACSNVNLSLDVDAMVPSMVLIDEMRLSQMLTNLLVNAAKFTQQGSIRLTCTLVSEEQHDHDQQQRHKGGVVLKIAVSDTGIGINQDDAKKLKAFRLFNKLTSSQYACLNPTGTGLGLAICHKIAPMLGGTFDFDSTLGDGEALCLRAPLRHHRVLTYCTLTKLSLLFVRFSLLVHRAGKRSRCCDCTQKANK
jgi:signal transduction histidine kinase